jgi:hypothetical protein
MSACDYTSPLLPGILGLEWERGGKGPVAAAESPPPLAEYSMRFTGVQPERKAPSAFPVLERLCHHL